MYSRPFIVNWSAQYVLVENKKQKECYFYRSII